MIARAKEHQSGDDFEEYSLLQYMVGKYPQATVWLKLLICRYPWHTTSGLWSSASILKPIFPLQNSQVSNQLYICKNKASAEPYLVNAQAIMATYRSGALKFSSGPQLDCIGMVVTWWLFVAP